MTSIPGTARTSGKGSTIKRVVVTLGHQIMVPGDYSISRDGKNWETPQAVGWELWNGKTWIRPEKGIPKLAAAWKTGQWHLSAGLPPVAKLSTGRYRIVVEAHDSADKVGYAERWFQVNLDPKLTINAPAERAKVSGIREVHGALTTVPGAAPVTAVKVQISRRVISARDLWNLSFRELGPRIQEQYWDGAAWVTEPPPALPATYNVSSPSGTWKLTNLPPDAGLEDGHYTIKVEVLNQPGTVAETTHNFQVHRSPTLTYTVPGSRPAIRTISELPSIEGTVQLVPGGIDVTEVKVAIHRLSVPGEKRSSEYWTGTAWKTFDAEKNEKESLENFGAKLVANYSPPTAPDTIGRWQ